MSEASPILMPKLGLTMTEGALVSWNVKPGDAVRTGDLLFTVETDKIATDVEARADGEIVSIAVDEGETVTVGTPVAFWTGPSFGADIGERNATPADEPAAVTEAEPVRSSHDGARVLATPLARRHARQRGLNLASVRGSGPRGRIKLADLPEGSRDVPVSASSAATRRPALSFEKIVARRLTEAKQTIPHFYVFANADITSLLVLREQLNNDANATRISLNHFIVAALAGSIATMPDVNSVWTADGIDRFENIDIGIVVDSPRGLIVPVLRGADRLGITGIADQATALVQKARDGRHDLSETEGGVFSISNVGMFGVTALVPIINPGQSGMLGVGAPTPVFRPDEHGNPRLVQEVSLVLSCDHRVLDGVRAAKLLGQVRALLEAPGRLLRHSVSEG